MPSSEGVVKCWNMSREGNVHWVCHVPYRELLLNTEESKKYKHVSVSLQSFTVDPMEFLAIRKEILTQYVAGCCGT